MIVKHIPVTLTCDRWYRTYHGSHFIPSKQSPDENASSDSWKSTLLTRRNHRFMEYSTLPSGTHQSRHFPTFLTVPWRYFRTHVNRCALWCTLRRATLVGWWFLYPIARRGFWMMLLPTRSCTTALNDRVICCTVIRLSTFIMRASVTVAAHPHAVVLGSWHW